MPDFAPDDDRDDEDGWDSFEEYLRERGDDMVYSDSIPDGVQTDRVEVDPALFGTFSDGPIEEIDRDGNGLVSGKTQHEWEREAMIVDMIGACPYCDADVTKREMRSPSGDLIIRRHCKYCDESWITNRDKGFTGQV